MKHHIQVKNNTYKFSLHASWIHSSAKKDETTRLSNPYTVVSLLWKFKATNSVCLQMGLKSWWNVSSDLRFRVWTSVLTARNTMWSFSAWYIELGECNKQKRPLANLSCNDKIVRYTRKIDYKQCNCRPLFSVQLLANLSKKKGLVSTKPRGLENGDFILKANLKTTKTCSTKPEEFKNKKDHHFRSFLTKTRHYYRGGIVFENLRFQNVFHQHGKRKAGVVKIFRFEECFRKAPVFDGLVWKVGLINRKNFSGVVWTYVAKL